MNLRVDKMPSAVDSPAGGWVVMGTCAVKNPFSYFYLLSGVEREESVASEDSLEGKPWRIKDKRDGTKEPPGVQDRGRLRQCSGHLRRVQMSPALIAVFLQLCVG
jgi:hypothetical protein